MSDFFEDYYASAHKRPGYVAAGLSLEIAKNIEQLLKDSNISYSELAHTLGCSKANVTKLLKGDANLTTKTLANIAIALDSEIKVVFIHKAKFKQLQKEVAELYENLLRQRRARENQQAWFTRVNSCSNDDSFTKPKNAVIGHEDARLSFA